MKTRLEEIEEMISENCVYMDSIYKLIELQKSVLSANDFLMKLEKRIRLEIEKSEILKNTP